MPGKVRAKVIFRPMGGRGGPYEAHLWGKGTTVTLLGAPFSKVLMYTT